MNTNSLSFRVAGFKGLMIGSITDRIYQKSRGHLAFEPYRWKTICYRKYSVKGEKTDVDWYKRREVKANTSPMLSPVLLQQGVSDVGLLGNAEMLLSHRPAHSWAGGWISVRPSGTPPLHLMMRRKIVYKHLQLTKSVLCLYLQLFHQAPSEHSVII